MDTVSRRNSLRLQATTPAWDHQEDRGVRPDTLLRSRCPRGGRLLALPQAVVVAAVARCS